MHIMDRITVSMNSFADEFGPAIGGIVASVGKHVEKPQLIFKGIEAHFESLYPQVPPQQVEQMPDALGQRDVQQLLLPPRDLLNPEIQAQLPSIREDHRAIGLLGMKLSATAATVALLATFSLGTACLTWGVGLGLTAVSIIRTGNASIQQTIDSMKDFGAAATSVTFQAVFVGAVAAGAFLSCKGTFMLIGALVKGVINGLSLSASLIGKVAVAGLAALKSVALFCYNLRR